MQFSDGLPRASAPWSDGQILFKTQSECAEALQSKELDKGRLSSQESAREGGGGAKTPPNTLTPFATATQNRLEPSLVL